MPTATVCLFPWRDAYSVKIDVLDSQHKRLVDLINQLHEAMITRTGKEHLGGLLSELIKYTKSHFRAEEGLLQQHQFPNLSIQKSEHERFTRTVLDFQGKFQRNEVALTIEVMDFLKDWLVKHIMDLDKGYGPFLTARGVR